MYVCIIQIKIYLYKIVLLKIDPNPTQFSHIIKFTFTVDGLQYQNIQTMKLNIVTNKIQAFINIFVFV